MNVIDFEQHGKKAIKDLQESLQAVTCFFDVHEEPTENLKSEHLPNIQQRITALKRAQEHTHNLTDSSDRLEAVELLVKAWEQLSQHAEVQYRLARKGLQQKRYVQITPEELKLEVSLHLELGEQHVETQKGLFLIKSWQKRLRRLASVNCAPNTISATSA